MHRFSLRKYNFFGTDNRYPFKLLAAKLSSKCSKMAVRLYPTLPEDVIKNMETVVAFFLLQDRVTWVVEDMHRTIIDWGQKEIFEKVPPAYDHLKYQDKIIEVVSALPNSSIYLMDASHYRKNMTPSSLSKSKYFVHKSITEALLITWININKRQTALDSWQKPLVQCSSNSVISGPAEYFDREKPSDLVQGNESIDKTKYSENNNKYSENNNMVYRSGDREETSDLVQGNQSIDNCENNNMVYRFLPRNYKDFYDLHIGGERLTAYPLVTELMRSNSGPLEGMTLPQEFCNMLHRPHSPHDRETFSTNLLMADAVVKFCVSR